MNGPEEKKMARNDTCKCDCTLPGPCFYCQLFFLLLLTKRKQINKLPKMKRWQETIHVNVTVLLQLLSKFRCQHLVHFWWEIAQCIGQSFLKEKTILKKKVKQQSWLDSSFFKESLPLGNFYDKRFHTFFERGKYSVLNWA